MIVVRILDGEGRKVLLVSLADPEAARLRQLRSEQRVPAYVRSALVSLCDRWSFWLIGGAGTEKGEKRLRWLEKMVATSTAEADLWEVLAAALGPMPEPEEAEGSSKDETGE